MTPICVRTCQSNEENINIHLSLIVQDRHLNMCHNTPYGGLCFVVSFTQPGQWISPHKPLVLKINTHRLLTILIITNFEAL